MPYGSILPSKVLSDCYLSSIYIIVSFPTISVKLPLPTEFTVCYSLSSIHYLVSICHLLQFTLVWKRSSTLATRCACLPPISLVHLPLYLSVCLDSKVFIYPLLWRLPICLSLCLSVKEPVYLFVQLHQFVFTSFQFVWVVSSIHLHVRSTLVFCFSVGLLSGLPDCYQFVQTEDNVYLHDTQLSVCLFVSVCLLVCFQVGLTVISLYRQ